VGSLSSYLPDPSVLGIPTSHWGTATTNAYTILSEFLAASQPLVVAIAAVVNSYAESRLDHQGTYKISPWTRPAILPSQTADNEKSSGLFMTNPAAGAAGAGMSEADRWDPIRNTRRILSIVEGSAGASLRNAYKSDASLAQMVAIFERDIERPAHPTGREAETWKLYPKLADVRASKLQAAAPTVNAIAVAANKIKRNVPAAVWVGLAAASIIGAVLFYIKTRRKR